jgi:hypothetical protein
MNRQLVKDGGSGLAGTVLRDGSLRHVSRDSVCRTPPTLSRSITVVAHGVMNLRTYLKRSGRVDEKLAVFDNPLMEVLKAWQSK